MLSVSHNDQPQIDLENNSNDTVDYSVKRCAEIVDDSEIEKRKAQNDEIPAGFTKVKKTRKHSIEEQILTREFNKHQREIAKAKWIQSVQDMADYFTKYGYEATCKKFNVNISPESMIMKFIRTRKLYGINFISQPDKKRKFQTPPEE